MSSSPRLFKTETTFSSYVQVVRADLYRYHGATGAGCFLKSYFRQPGFRYTFWMRTSKYLSQTVILRFPYWMALWQLRRLQVKYGISICHDTDVGPGLYIGHFGGIVTNDRTIMGRNCNLSHGVTIGQKNQGKFKGYPKIGDSVYIGPGACIIGSVSVGSNVAVGAHAVVVDNAYDNEVVVGNPARSVSMKAAKDYVNWRLDSPF